MVIDRPRAPDNAHFNVHYTTTAVSVHIYGFAALLDGVRRAAGKHYNPCTAVDILLQRESGHELKYLGARYNIKTEILLIRIVVHIIRYVLSLFFRQQNAELSECYQKPREKNSTPPATHVH
jgi:hypothetical protein